MVKRLLLALGLLAGVLLLPWHYLQSTPDAPGPLQVLRSWDPADGGQAAGEGSRPRTIRDLFSIRPGGAFT